jgi:hypothetical protein
MHAMHACQAVEWGGKKKILVNSKRPVPVITDPVRADGCTCKSCSARAKTVVCGMHVVAVLGHSSARSQCPARHVASDALGCCWPLHTKLLSAAGGCHHQSHVHSHLWIRPAHVRICALYINGHGGQIVPNCEMFCQLHSYGAVCCLSRYLAAMPGMRKGDLLGHEVI